MKTIVLLENCNKFTFMEGEKTTKVKIGGNPVIYDVVELKTPKKGEKLEFKYDCGCAIDEFLSSSNIESITTE